MATDQNGERAPNDCQTRVLNVAIPEWVYWHIRRCATESRMSLKSFMAVFCQSARPLQMDHVGEVPHEPPFPGTVDAD